MQLRRRAKRIFNKDSDRYVKTTTDIILFQSAFGASLKRLLAIIISGRYRLGERDGEVPRIFHSVMFMIISHEHEAYRRKWQGSGANQYNGAFYYSKEIVKNIIPNVETDRNWVTVNVQGYGCNHAIVFIHNNLHPERYEWLGKLDDLILVCGIKETVPKVKHLGKAIYLPLSIDTEYVKQFRVEEKTKEVAFVGRRSKMRLGTLPKDIDFVHGIWRQRFLQRIAEYKKVYAVGRTAIESVYLGCEVLPYDNRFPDPTIWKVIDNKDAAKMLQRELDRIDGRK